MAISHTDHLAQIKALWALEGLNALDVDLLKQAAHSQKKHSFQLENKTLCLPSK